jgi:hypothetical protein
VLFQVAIELVSGTARLFSLSFRLFANIMAGHSILQLVSGIFHCVQSTMLLVTWAMEAGLALLQAYVFGALLLIYAGQTHPGLSCLVLLSAGDAAVFGCAALCCGCMPSLAIEMAADM